MKPDLPVLYVWAVLLSPSFPKDTIILPQLYFFFMPAASAEREVISVHPLALQFLNFQIDQTNFQL